jgi:hypothetical protein
MVSLENRITYSYRINESPKLSAFNNLLLNNDIVSPRKQDLNEYDEIYFEIVKAVHANDKDAFEYYYNKKSKSHPSKESPTPFVNDDFLIFCLLIGLKKFDLNKDWIKNILSIRSRSAITITFNNILNDNYNSNDNLYEIVLMYFQINNPDLITNELFNNAYKRIIKNDSLFDSKSDFQILCTLRAYDLIIELKDGSEINLLKQFNSRFLKRIKLLSVFIQTLFVLILLYAITFALSNIQGVNSFINNYNLAMRIVSLFGLSLLSNTVSSIRKKIYKISLSIFGYPKELIKQIKKHSDIEAGDIT